MPGCLACREVQYTYKSVSALFLFNTYQMKAKIRIVTAAKEFSSDQIQIMKRVTMVLIEHGLSVDLQVEQKKYKSIKLKAV